MTRPAAAWTRRVDARLPLLVCLTYVAVVLLTPLSAWRLLIVEAWLLALAIGLTGVASGVVLRRWAGMALGLVVLAWMVSLSHPARRELGAAGTAAALASRALLAAGAVVVTSAAWPPERLIAALARLGAPRAAVGALHFMHRYAHILVQERDRMMLARRARSFRGRGLGWGALAGLIGALFVRAAERGERVHAAMLARGWDGTLRWLDDDSGGAP